MSSPDATKQEHNGRDRFGPSSSLPLLRDQDLTVADLLSFCAERLGEISAEVGEAEMAERTGAGAEAVRRFVAGESEPGLGFIIALCREYGLSAEWLLFGVGPRDLRDVPAHAIETACSRTLIKALSAQLEDLR